MLRKGEFFCSIPLSKIRLDLDLKHYTNETTKKGNPIHLLSLSIDHNRALLHKTWLEIILLVDYNSSLETHWGSNRIRVVTMQAHYAQKVGMVLARRAIMIVNKIHDVTMYNASSQSNMLNTRDPEFLRMRISKKRSEYCQEIALSWVEYSNDIEREFYIGRET